MQEVNKDAASKYGLEIKNAVQHKDGHIITCEKGRKLLKKTLLSPQRLIFIHEVKEHLYKSGFVNLDRFVCTPEGQPFTVVGETRFVMTDFVEGKECNFDVRVDMMRASTALAQFHKASKGFASSEAAMARDELGKMPIYFARRLEEIKKLKKNAKKGRTKFDYLFLDWADQFYLMGEKALGDLKESAYDRLVKEAREGGTLCHHDFTHNNILCTDKGVWVVNYDYCCHELKSYDLANLLRRKMRKCNWDIAEAKAILDEYRKVEPLSEDEFKIMEIMLRFPQKFWRVANKYYNSKRCWSETSYLQRLQEVVREVGEHRIFMERFSELE